jgi:hypothetical protein
VALAVTLGDVCALGVTTRVKMVVAILMAVVITLARIATSAGTPLWAAAMTRRDGAGSKVAARRLFKTDALCALVTHY